MRYLVRSGLIPAHAGKTTCTPPTPTPGTAHPRSRGENFGGGQVPALAGGSSPLTRGKPSPPASRVRSSGLIPAHAGKTSEDLHDATESGAHPRSRGENGTALTAAINPPGSSPLTRGKQEIAARAGDETGLIPAHAGKTRDGVLKSMSIGAHPRSRGENSALVR